MYRQYYEEHCAAIDEEHLLTRWGFRAGVGVLHSCRFLFCKNQTKKAPNITNIQTIFLDLKLTNRRIQDMHINRRRHHIRRATSIIPVMALIRFGHQQNAGRPIHSHLNALVVIDHPLLVVPEDVSGRFRRLPERAHQSQ